MTYYDLARYIRTFERKGSSQLTAIANFDLLVFFVIFDEFLTPGDSSPIFPPTVVVGICFLGGGFKYVLFSSLFGEDVHFDSYFSDGWFNHQRVFPWFFPLAMVSGNVTRTHSKGES